MINFQEISREREELAAKIKDLKSRKDKLDQIIKGYLENHEELRTIGVLYKIQIATKLKYPFIPTNEYLSNYPAFSELWIKEKAIIEKDGLIKIAELIAKNTECSVPFLLKESIMKDLSYIAEKSYTKRLITKEIK